MKVESGIIGSDQNIGYAGYPHTKGQTVYQRHMQ